MQIHGVGQRLDSSGLGRLELLDHIDDTRHLGSDRSNVLGSDVQLCELGNFQNFAGRDTHGNGSFIEKIATHPVSARRASLLSALAYASDLGSTALSPMPQLGLRGSGWQLERLLLDDL